MKIRFYIACLLAIFFLTGCVSSDSNYKPASYHEINNSTVVDIPRDTVWKRLVSGLGQNFFVINNMDKESGFINLSYSGDPENYIDGGELYFMVKNMAGKREYRFPAARKYAKYEIFEGMYLLKRERTLDLEGRMNIILLDQEDNKTQVTINTKYILTQITTAVDPAGKHFPTITETISFNTGQTERNRAGTIYRATGDFEKEVLDLIRN